MGARDAVRALGGHLGPRSEQRARRLVHTWGRTTAGARMSPSVIVVGAQRCGTTTVFRLMAAHPGLTRPVAAKGTGYFDDEHTRSWDWYLGHFPLRRPGQLAFECSGYYLFHPLAASRIAAALPDVQVVVLVRDPVERAASAHRHEVARGFDTLDLDDALAVEGVRTAGEEHRLRTVPGYRSFSHRHHAYLQRGEYAGQIRRFQAALGPDRVHVVDADAFFADPRQQFLRLQVSLGLAPWAPPRVEVWNARPGPPLDPGRRRELMHHFEPHDAELADILGAVPTWRRQAAAA